jgi:hypothetical protein
LATQLEEPFTILPMQAFCDKIYNWCNEIVSFTAGDNGMTVHEARPEHTVAFLGDGSLTSSSSSTTSHMAARMTTNGAVASFDPVVEQGYITAVAAANGAENGVDGSKRRGFFRK